MQAIEPVWMSEAEFLALPDGPERLELFDGQLLVSPSCSPRHQAVLGTLAVELTLWARTHRPLWQVLFAPLDLWVGPLRIFQPDLMVFDAPLGPDAVRPVTAVPVLVAEVLSPSNRDHDRFGKRLAYAERGIRTYLVVDPLDDRVEVFTGQGLTTRTLARARLHLDACPGLDLDVDALLAR